MRPGIGSALSQRVTYANAMSTIAVFIALGGTSYAAIKLPKNSVGPTQIKVGAVTSAAIRDRAVTATDLAPGVVGSGPRGPRGETGPAGPSGAGVTAEGWRPLILINDWSNYNGPTGPWFNASFRKDSAGRVELRGLVVHAGAPTRSVIGVLPAGYVPNRAVLTHGMMADGTVDQAGRINIHQDGTIVWWSGPSGVSNYTSLDGITFSLD